MSNEQIEVGQLPIGSYFRLTSLPDNIMIVERSIGNYVIAFPVNVRRPKSQAILKTELAVAEKRPINDR